MKIESKYFEACYHHVRAAGGDFGESGVACSVAFVQDDQDIMGSHRTHKEIRRHSYDKERHASEDLAQAWFAKDPSKVREDASSNLHKGIRINGFRERHEDSGAMRWIAFIADQREKNEGIELDRVLMTAVTDFFSRFRALGLNLAQQNLFLIEKTDRISHVEIVWMDAHHQAISSVNRAEVYSSFDEMVASFGGMENWVAMSRQAIAQLVRKKSWEGVDRLFASDLVKIET